LWKQETATVPPRIIKKRSVWAASLFSFSLGAFFFSLVYYLPIWFQAVKGASAVKSGIMSLPLILTLVVVSIFAGIGVTIGGYYTPFMIVSSVFAAIGVGLLTTFTPGTNHGKWIGFQAITGIGVGLGMQQPLMAIQTVLEIADVPVGTSVIIFIQTLGGALFVSISQNVFTNKLIQNLAKYVPGLDPEIVLRTGATSIQATIEEQYLKGVTLAYNDAITRVFIVAASMAALTMIGALAIEWKSMKGKKVEMAVA